MGFREVLPAGCPPANSHNGACAIAFRFVSTATPKADAFESYATKGGLPPDGVDPCRWASCSLYPDLATVNKKRKLPGLKKYGFVAEIIIKAGSGHLIEDSKHIDFWMYDTFDPVASIVIVRAL